MTWRDVMCGDVRPEHVGQRLALAGWAHRRRDHGGLVFIDLRDREGLCQLVINPEHAPAAATAAHSVRNEFVLRAEGEVVARAPGLVNPNLPTGEVELRVATLEIVSTAPPLPFQLDEEGVDETLRLRYRWLDLRREKLQRNIRLRSQMVSIIRRVMESAGFLDIQTPILFKPTPEGARDFVVPSRLQPGRFYALPQSPQILKQLLVIAGFDRYYQIAVCFRDEDLRADRVQEITQLDVEMAFPDREFIVDLMERMVQAVWHECIDVELAIPFRRMSYDDAMLRYGTDKPDLRFGLEIEDVTEVTRGSEFNVFAGAEAVRLLRVPGAISRAELGRLEDVAKGWGAKGLAYVVWEGGEPRTPIAKFLSDAELEAFRGEPDEDGAVRCRHARRLRAGARQPPAADGRRARPRRRERLRVDLDRRLPDVRLVGGRAALAGEPPSVHASRPRVGGAVRQGAWLGEVVAVRPRRQRQRAGRRLVQDPRGRPPGARVRRASALARGATIEVRLPARRARDGRAAARRDRLRDRPDAHGARARSEPPGHDRLPEEPGWRRPDERRAFRRFPEQLDELGIRVLPREQ